MKYGGVVLTWVLAAAFAGGVLALGDARALLSEDGAWVLAVPLLHLVVGGLWSWRALQRDSRWAPALAVLPAVLIAAVVWAPAAPVAWRAAGAPSATRGAARGPSVVLVTLDTFRADRLDAARSPRLAAFAAQGVTFTQAVACAPLTAPSHACLLTGRASGEHGLRGNGGHLAIDTIVSDIAARGYRTGAFVSARVLARDTGLDAGFDHYDDAWTIGHHLAWVPVLRPLGRWGLAERPGAATVARALAWLSADDAPAFLWVHLYEPHVPYVPDAAHAPTPAALAAARQEDRDHRADRELSDVEGAHAAEGRLLYDAEIATVDARVGELLDALPASAIVVVVGDHGEALGEHGYWFNHGALLHEPALRVPFVARWPGVFGPGETIDGLVGTVHVADVLRAAAGGGSFVRFAPDDRVVAYTPGQQNRRPPPGTTGRRAVPTAAVRLPTAKIVATASDPARYFDLAADPGELAPAVIPAALSDEAARAASLAVPGDPTDAERLRALGYVE